MFQTKEPFQANYLSLKGPYYVKIGGILLHIQFITEKNIIIKINTSFLYSQNLKCNPSPQK